MVTATSSKRIIKAPHVDNGEEQTGDTTTAGSAAFRGSLARIEVIFEDSLDVKPTETESLKNKTKSIMTYLEVLCRMVTVPFTLLGFRLLLRNITIL